MQIVVESGNVPVDAWLSEFLRTTVRFAVWHHTRLPERVTVLLGRADAASGGGVRCYVRAERRNDAQVSAGATGGEASEAIQQACDLLEAALHAPTLPGRPLQHAA